MSLPNGSIANLLVTCKSLVTRNLRCPFPVPFPDADDRLGGTRTQIKSRRWKGAKPHGLILRSDEESIASRRMIELVASFAPPGTSFEAASRRLRTRWLGFTNKKPALEGRRQRFGEFLATFGGERLA
jgi:hypothetical protein